MTDLILTICFLIIGIIHLLPMIGFAGPDKLFKLYGVECEEHNLQILMRHRAVLFGLLGGVFVYAAFEETVQGLALVLSGISIASFFYLAKTVGNYNEGIRKVVIADVIAAIAWIAALILKI